MMDGIVEKVRSYAASVDGTLLDDQIWSRRHRRILAIGLLLTSFTLVFTLADPQPNVGEQWAYGGGAVGACLLASIPRLSRRARELSATMIMVFTQVYVLRFVGNFTLGPLSIILITFYQDWVPIAAGLVLVMALVVLAWADPTFYNGARALAPEVPGIGMGLRAGAVILSAALSLAIWRSGTQQARDQLTGMLSRAGAERLLNRALARGRHPAVWVCDIDNFSAVNLQLGPAAGDQLLRHVASELRQVANTLPSSTISARLGGDTFLIAAAALPDLAMLGEFAHRIEAATSARVVEINGSEVPLRLSVGASVGAAEQGSELIRTAELNMRDAKGRGLRRVVVGQRPAPVSSHAAPLLAGELYRACRERELELYLQPIVRLADGCPVGAEMLARWNHPARGVLLPGQFLPDSERDSALMAVVSGTLGAAFLQTVADLLRRHGPDWLGYGFSYNLAAVRLRDPTLPEVVARHLAQAGLDAAEAHLHLEVTEGALMDIEFGVPELLAGLRNLGYKLALDDFGTGHSSLAHLRDFPLDSVKIDKSFIHSLERSPTDVAVVQAVADIASVSGLTVVAEGVETPAQRELLLRIKPDILAQGWLYARAMPVAEFERWVQAQLRAVVA